MINVEFPKKYKVRSLDKWHEIITGTPPIPDSNDFLWEEHCTACKEVMLKGRCIKNECKYFKK